MDINKDQSDFWNSEPGQRWVRYQGDLGLLHERVTRLLLEAARPAPGERVLDVGCGAGASTFATTRSPSIAPCSNSTIGGAVVQPTTTTSAAIHPR